MEQWRTVVHNGETFPNYEVSTEGRVRSLNYKRTGEIKVLKQQDNGIGYLQVGLTKGKKQYWIYVHDLVLETFEPTDDKTLEVNHINKNRHDNRLENLEWLPHKENIVYSNAKRVKCIETGQEWESLAQASDFLGTTVQNLHAHACLTV